MLILRRKRNQWIDVTHRSGDVLRIRVCNIETGDPKQVHIGFDEDNQTRNFEIERPERNADLRAEVRS